MRYSKVSVLCTAIFSDCPFQYHWFDLLWLGLMNCIESKWLASQLLLTFSSGKLKLSVSEFDCLHVLCNEILFCHLMYFMLSKCCILLKPNFHAFYAFWGSCVISLLIFGKLFEPHTCVWYWKWVLMFVETLLVLIIANIKNLVYFKPCWWNISLELYILGVLKTALLRVWSLGRETWLYIHINA